MENILVALASRTPRSKNEADANVQNRYGALRVQSRDYTGLSGPL